MHIRDRDEADATVETYRRADFKLKLIPSNTYHASDRTDSINLGV